MAKRDEEQQRRLRGEHLESYTQDAPIGALSKIPDIKRGMKQWGPDLAALPGDLWDLGANALRNAVLGVDVAKARGNIPSTGAASRRFATQQKPRAQTEMTEWKEPSMTEEAVRFVNPMMWGNPFKLAQGPLGKVMAAMMGDFSGGLGVIKSKGGNWLAGEHSPEFALNRIRKGGDSEVYDALNQLHPDIARQLDVSSTDAFGDLAKRFPKEWAQAQSLSSPIDSWIQGPLMRYVKRDMATEHDPIRKLAEQGVLHVDPQELNFNMDSYGKFPHEGQTFMAEHPTAKAWEGVTDNSLHMTPRWMWYSDDASGPVTSRAFSDNPWLSKVPEDTPIHALQEPRHFADDLRLNQLVDSTYDDLLQGVIRPEQLRSGNFSVEAAVRRAHEKRLAEKAAAEAEALKALMSEATPIHKEYPEGWKWIEFKAPEGAPKVIPEGYSIQPDVEYLGKRGFQVVGPRGRFGTPQATREEAQEILNKLVLDGSLQRALNAEGDYMGHCVGSYCQDVVNGDTRVFSLRDPSGKPYVTVEAGKSNQVHDYEADAVDWVYKHHPDLDETDPDKFQELVTDRMFELSRQPKPEWNILQIKGSGKKDSSQKITPEDLKLVQPYVQDFLNSQPWNKTQDLSNAGLRDMRDLYGENLPQGELPFMTHEQQQDFNRRFPDLKSRMSQELESGDWEPEFAEGGLVRGPEFFDNLDMFLAR